MSNSSGEDEQLFDLRRCSKKTKHFKHKHNIIVPAGFPAILGPFPAHSRPVPGPFPARSRPIPGPLPGATPARPRARCLNVVNTWVKEIPLHFNMYCNVTILILFLFSILWKMPSGYKTRSI